MTYDATVFTHAQDIKLKPETLKLLDQANAVYKANFDGKTWYGRCIFFSWYCKKGTCTFCYRSTLKHKIRHAKTSARSMGSMLLEALFCRLFDWRIEFLTGGYQEEDDKGQIAEYAKYISAVYGKKIWVNIGVIDKQNLEKLLPHIKGVVASIETPVKKLHDQVCPDKPMEPYEEMLESLPSYLKKSACFIVGMGDDSDEDFEDWCAFIEKHSLDRITVYALKPIRNGAFSHGPSHDLYLSTIAKLRIRFPTLEIIGGTNLRRSEESGYMIRAGANAVTKFPATKQFGTHKAKKIVQMIEDEGRSFFSNILTVPESINWDEEINSLDIPEEFKQQMREQLPLYLENFRHPKDKDSNCDCE